MKTLLAILLLAALPAGAQVTFTARVDRPVVLASPVPAITLQLSVEVGLPAAGERLPLHLALVVDGSRKELTAGDNLLALNVFRELPKRLQATDRLAVVGFAETAVLLAPASVAADLDLAALAARMPTFGGNGSALFAALSLAAADLRASQRGSAIRQIVLVSDGHGSLGPRSAEAMGRLGTALRKEGIAVTCFGLGITNADALTRLAESSGGHFYLVERPGELDELFGREIGLLRQSVGWDARLTFRAADGTSVGKLLGRQGRVLPDGIEVRPGLLTAGQPLVVLAELAVTPGTAGDVRAIGDASCTWTEPATGRRRELTVPVQIRFTADPDEVQQALNQDILANTAATVEAMVKDQTIDLVDEGRTGEAIRNLILNSSNLAEQGRFFDNGGMIQSSVNLAAEAERLRAQQEITPGQRQQMRVDSYNQRNDWSNALFINGHVEGGKAAAEASVESAVEAAQ